MQYGNGYIFARSYSRMYSPRMTIGDRLDKAMHDAKIESQSELHRRSGVPQATISRILKGSSPKGPETDTIKKLAKACRVSFEWLNEGVGSGEQAALPADELIRASLSSDVLAVEMIELLTLYKDATGAERRLIMSSARLHIRRRRILATDATGN